MPHIPASELMCTNSCKSKRTEAANPKGLHCCRTQCLQWSSTRAGVLTASGMRRGGWERGQKVILFHCKKGPEAASTQARSSSSSLACFTAAAAAAVGIEGCCISACVRARARAGFWKEWWKDGLAAWTAWPCEARRQGTRSALDGRVRTTIVCCCCCCSCDEDLAAWIDRAIRWLAGCSRDVRRRPQRVVLWWQVLRISPSTRERASFGADAALLAISLAWLRTGSRSRMACDMSLLLLLGLAARELPSSTPVCVCVCAH